MCDRLGIKLGILGFRNMQEKLEKKRLIRKVGEQVSAFNTNVVRVELERVCLNFSLLLQKK